jgi:signal transduction histidine kinase
MRRILLGCEHRSTAPGAPVAVRLAEEDGWLEFSVADHGPGFDLRIVERGSGLRNLADRIEAVGGNLDMRSEPDQGTTITGRVPAQTGERT